MGIACRIDHGGHRGDRAFDQFGRDVVDGIGGAIGRESESAGPGNITPATRTPANAELPASFATVFAIDTIYRVRVPPIGTGFSVLRVFKTS